MKVMLNCNLQYAPVLNLSDILEAKRNVLSTKIKDMENAGISHSIFYKNRQDDFNQLWVNTATVIYGWGVSIKLKPLALNAIAACNTPTPYGILKANTNWVYYHLLPHIHSKQQEWVEEVSKQLKS
jgi:hypothetical protein